jgi:hypothetical protein
MKRVKKSWEFLFWLNANCFCFKEHKCWIFIPQLYSYLYTLLMHAFYFPLSFFSSVYFSFFFFLSFNTLHYVFIYCFEMLFNFVKKVFLFSPFLLFLHILLTSFSLFCKCTFLCIHHHLFICSSFLFLLLLFWLNFHNW